MANIDVYAKKFINEGILAFRDANLTEDEQKEFQKRWGDHFKIYPNSIDDSVQQYTEDHEGMREKNVSGKDIMLGWHMEHLYFKNPIIVGFWNMHVFNTSKENGQTYFYDSRVLHDVIPVDWKDFLARCTIDSTNKLDALDKKYLSDVLVKHWYTNEPVLRICVNKFEDEQNVLKKIDGREPTQEEENEYNRIMAGIKDLLNSDTEHRIIHKWKKGDLVIPDMYVMIHAVTGGFKKDDRVFTGMWSFPEPYVNALDS